MGKSVTKYDYFRLKIGVTSACLGALGAKIPIELMLNVPTSWKIALLFSDVCLAVAAYLGGFFTDNEKKEDKE